MILANCGRCSYAYYLRQVIEVFVARMKCQVVLQNQRGEPHIVGGDWCALFLELMKNGGVMVGGLLVGKQDKHPLLEEEPPECSFVVRLSATVNEAGSKFAEDDERQQDGVGFFEQRHRFVDALAEIDVAIGVEGDPHRQRSAST